MSLTPDTTRHILDWFAADLADAVRDVNLECGLRALQAESAAFAHLATETEHRLDTIRRLEAAVSPILAAE